MEQLLCLKMSHNGGISDQGFIYLARAIGERGMPSLENIYIHHLAGITDRGIVAMTLALIKSCRYLEVIHLTSGWDTDDLSGDLVQSMLQAGGRAEEVRVT